MSSGKAAIESLATFLAKGLKYPGAAEVLLALRDLVSKM